MNNNPQGRFASLKDSTIPALVTPHSQKVSAFHKNLCQATGEKLKELQVNETWRRAHLQNVNVSFQTTSLSVKDFDYVQFLQELALEQQFEVTFVDVEEKTLKGENQCLLQLSTLPVAVCYGCGMSSKDAQARAAQSALEYLKLMTKKWDGTSSRCLFGVVAFYLDFFFTENIVMACSFLCKTKSLLLETAHARCRQESFFTSYTLHRISGFFLNLLCISKTLIRQVELGFNVFNVIKSMSMVK